MPTDRISSATSATLLLLQISGVLVTVKLYVFHRLPTRGGGVFLLESLEVIIQRLLIEPDILSRLVGVEHLHEAKDLQSVRDSNIQIPGTVTGISSGIETVDAASALGAGDDSDELG